MSEPIISKRLKRRRIFTVASLVFLMAFSGLLVTSKYFNKSTLAISAHGILSQNDTTTYAGQDIVVESGNTFVVDGVHSEFKSVTVEDGGVLTTNDFNRYGVYQPKDQSINARNLFPVVADGAPAYVFIFRGFINTGTYRHEIYGPSSGSSDDVSKTQPNSLLPDDVMSIDFFNAVPSPVYSDALYASSAKAGSAFANHDSTASRTVFTDNISSDSNTIIPFEVRFANISGISDFGLSFCHAGTDCTSQPNNLFLKTVGGDNLFSIPASTSIPEMKTSIAWQGMAGSAYQGTLNTYRTSYADFKYLIDFMKEGSGYTPNVFYQADDFDFSFDPKVVLRNDVNMLSSPYPISVTNQAENFSISSLPLRKYSNFYPTGQWNTPLASGYDDSGNVGYGYPTLSRSLALGLPRKIPTYITTAGTFTVKSGGKVNINGKGYARAYVESRGAGPGAITYTPDAIEGASHSGHGGGGTKTDSTPYDIVDGIEPLMPGSSGWDVEDQTRASGYVSYGGGYIKIDAKRIELQTGSMIYANAVGGNARYEATGSGGSIVLIDHDATSRYSGAITAFGGACRRDGASPGPHGKCTNGGGGGGYIYINTNSDTSGLIGRKLTDEKKYLPVFWFTPEDSLVGPTISQLVSMGFLENTISAQGGQTEATDTWWGDYGIVSINTRSPNTVSVKKTVNPYNVNPGDVVTITLRISNNGAGGFSLNDEFLNDGNGKFFTSVAGSISTTKCTFETSDAAHPKLNCSTLDALDTLITYQLKAPLD